MAKKTTNTKADLLSYSDTRSAINRFDGEAKSVMSKLLQEVNTFNDKHKIEVQYRATEQYIEVGKPQMPKTLLNFLLSKYVEANKGAKKKPTTLMLLAMLYKHQKFNVVYKRRLAITPEPIKQIAKEDASAAVVSMVSTPDNTTMAPPVSPEAGDIAQGPCYTILNRANGVICHVYGDNALAIKLEKLGKRWSVVKRGATIVKTNKSED